MKIITANNLGDVGTAVFYKFHKYIPVSDINSSDIPSIIENCRSYKIQFRGNKTDLSNKDFSEYNFSYLIDKYKFNDKLLINQLDSSSKKLIGNKLDDLEKIENIMFPSYINIGEEQTDSFFGSTLISNQTFISLLAEENCWKIEFYEDAIESNNNIYGGFIEEELLDKLGIEKIKSPIITVTLGPENTIRNNSSDMYYSYDPMLKDKENNDRLNIKEYAELLEEINYSKVVWLFLSSDKTTVNINLSYKSWISNKNPNRNMNKFIIRNDELWSTLYSVGLIEKDKNTNFWYDKNSGLLVGNGNIIEKEKCPILNKKIRKITNKYSPYINYKLGDKVEYGGKLWESVTKDNYGNDPVLTKDWVLSEKLNDYCTPKISVLAYPNNSGNVTPNGTLSIFDSSESKKFILTGNAGYQLDKDYPCLTDLNNPIQDKNYKITTNIEENGAIFKTVEILNWTDIIKAGKLIFNFSLYGCYSKFVANYNNSIINYSDWINYFDEFNFRIIKLIVNDKETIPEFNENNLIFQPKDKISIYFPDLIKYTIIKIVSNYIIKGDLFEKEISFEKNEYGEYILNDVADYSNATYSLILEDKTLTVSVGIFNGYEISKIIQSCKYGTDCNIMFYPIEETTVFKLVKVIDEKDKVYIDITELGNEYSFRDTNITLLLMENNIYNLSLKNITSNFKIDIE